MQKPEAAIQTLDKVFNDPKLDANAVLSIAQAYAALGNVPKLEAALEKLTKVMPDKPRSLVRPGGPEMRPRQIGGGAGRPPPGAGFERQAAEARPQSARLARQRQERGALRSAAAITRVQEAGAALDTARRRYFRW